MWYEWNGWIAVSALSDMIISLLTLITIIIAFYNLVGDKKNRIQFFVMINDTVPKTEMQKIEEYNALYTLAKEEKFDDLFFEKVLDSKIEITLKNTSNYPVEIFRYTVYIKRNILIHLLLILICRIFNVKGELCKKREYFVYRNIEKITIKENESVVQTIPLEYFKLLDIFYYFKFERLILSSMRICIEVDCYSKIVKKKSHMTLYRARNEFLESLEAKIAIGNYINGNDNVNKEIFPDFLRDDFLDISEDDMIDILVETSLEDNDLETES